MKVTLVGAGPYDRDLITVKGLKALKNAEVVLYDRLIGEEIINLIPKDAEKINVGKNANNHLIPQEEINKLLLEKAQKGLNVVRLKGGDPYVFGRGGEEVEFLADNNIEFEVIPGISSAISGGCYAGIPVTHRDCASSIHIITGHSKKNEPLNIDFESLVKLKGTLIFLMSVKTLEDICLGLLRAGIKSDMPAAIVENATSSKQRKFIGTVETLLKISKENNIVSPSLIIVGEVCKYSDELDWFSKKPLHNLKILVTRAKSNESKLVDGLKELGADAIEFPCIKLQENILNNLSLDNSIENINTYSWLVFTSPQGVNIFFKYLEGRRIDIRKLSHLKIGAVGKETEKELIKRGIFADFIPKEFNGYELGKGLVNLIHNHEKVLLLRANIGSEDILEVFKENNILYDNVSIYNTEYENEDGNFIGEKIANGEIDYVTFTSASTVKGFVNSIKNLDFKSINGICIGEKTAEKAREYGIKTYISKEATIKSMIEFIKGINK